jgi:hypothetical protein
MGVGFKDQERGISSHVPSANVRYAISTLPADNLTKLASDVAIALLFDHVSAAKRALGVSDASNSRDATMSNFPSALTLQAMAR